MTRDVEQRVEAEPKKEITFGMLAVALFGLPILAGLVVALIALFFLASSAISVFFQGDNFVGENQHVTGTVILNEERPSIRIPVSLEDAGDSPNLADIVQVRLTRTNLGTSSETSDVSIVTTDAGEVGEGIVTLTSTQPERGPTLVEWEIFVIGEDGGPPILTVDAPPDDVGPTPVARIELSEFVDTGIVSHRASVNLGAGQGGLLIRLSDDAGLTREGLAVQVAGGEVVTVPSAEALRVPRPDGCADGCTFRVELVDVEGATQFGHTIEFLVSDDTDLDVSIESVEHIEQEVDVMFDPPPLTDGEFDGRFTLGVRFSAQPPTPGDTISIDGGPFTHAFGFERVSRVAPSGCGTFQFGYNQSDVDAPATDLRPIEISHTGPEFDVEGNPIERGALEAMVLDEDSVEAFCDE